MLVLNWRSAAATASAAVQGGPICDAKCVKTTKPAPRVDFKDAVVIALLLSREHKTEAAVVRQA